ncbi:hypothetical protein Tco_0697716 [Tanacetum coccineum]
MMLLACTSPTHYSHGDRYDLRYRLSSIILYWDALILSFLAFCRSLGSVPNRLPPKLLWPVLRRYCFITGCRDSKSPLTWPANTASHSASLLVVSNLNLRALPQELSSIHDTFNVFNLRKCLADANLQVPLEEIEIEDKLHFVEEPVTSVFYSGTSF